MARRVPPLQQDIELSPAAPLVFLPGAGGGLAGVHHLLQPTSTILSPTIPSHMQTWRPMVTSPRCWLLLSASWRPRRGLTNFALYWWGGQMASNWPLLPRNPAWPCSAPTPTSLDSTLKCESVTPLNRTPKILGVALDTHFTLSSGLRRLSM